jgi:hypothetical protein
MNVTKYELKYVVPDCLEIDGIVGEAVDSNIGDAVGKVVVLGDGSIVVGKPLGVDVRNKSW